MIGAGSAVRSAQHECNVKRFPAMGKSMCGFVILTSAHALSRIDNFFFFIVLKI
jgi:hypothetical protein